jgi:hypothetical protein
VLVHLTITHDSLFHIFPYHHSQLSSNSTLLSNTFQRKLQNKPRNIYCKENHYRILFCYGVHSVHLVIELTEGYTTLISYCLCFSPLQFGGARVVEGETARFVGTRRSPLPRVASPSTLGSSCSVVLVQNTERETLLCRV